MLLVTHHDLLLVKGPIPVLVHELEDLLKILLLLLAGEVARDEGHRGLLDLLVTPELLQIAQGSGGHFCRDPVDVRVVLDPCVVQSVKSIDSIIRVEF